MAEHIITGGREHWARLSKIVAERLDLDPGQITHLRLTGDAEGERIEFEGMVQVGPGFIAECLRQLEAEDG